jgi:acyl carrier protein
MAVKFVAPGNDTERGVARIWEQLLGIEPVGIHDDFFRLGGHSLIGTQLIAHICSAFEVDLPLSRLAELRTVAGIAAVITAEKSRQQARRRGLLERVNQLSEAEVRAEIERRVGEPELKGAE